MAMNVTKELSGWLGKSSGKDARSLIINDILRGGRDVYPGMHSQNILTANLGQCVCKKWLSKMVKQAAGLTEVTKGTCELKEFM